MRLFADECFPRHLYMREFRELVQRDAATHQLIHVSDQYRQGMDDGKVLELLQRDAADSILVTGDNGKHSKAGDIRLPIEAPLRGVRTIVLVGKNCHSHPFVKARALLAVWDEITRIANDPVRKWPRYKLRRSPNNSERWELRWWPAKTIERRLAANGYKPIR